MQEAGNELAGFSNQQDHNSTKCQDEKESLSALAGLNGSCKELLQYFQSGGLLNVHSPRYLERMSADIKNLLREVSNRVDLDGGLSQKYWDLKMKDKVLKIYRMAFHAVQKARFLKQWERFEITVSKIDGIRLSCCVDRESRIQTEVAAVFETGRTPESLPSLPSKIFSSEIVYNSNVYLLNHNPIITSDHFLVIKQTGSRFFLALLKFDFLIFVEIALLTKTGMNFPFPSSRATSYWAREFACRLDVYPWKSFRKII